MIRALFLGLLLFSQPALAFRTYGIKWAITKASPQICWALATPIPSSIEISEAEVITMIENSIARWENVSTSFLEFTQCAEPSDVTDSDTILVTISETETVSTGGCASVSSTGNCNGGVVNLLAGSFTNLTLSIGWLQVITHEFGHAVGLLHSDRPSIMSYHKPTVYLSSDDWAALSFLYPNDSVDDYAPYGCGSINMGSGGNGSNGLGAVAPLLLAMFFVLVRKRKRYT